MPMTDPIAITIAFSGNLEEKNHKYPSKIFWILFSLKIYMNLKKKKGFRPRVSSAILFQNNLKIIFLNKGQNTDDGS